MHLPHDSSRRKFKKNLAISTMQVFSSMTIIPPEPIIEPALVKLSKSIGKSSFSLGIQPPEGPPVCTALNSFPPGIPPPISKITSFSVIPIGTSTKPVLLILPTRENILVPLLPFVPICENQSAPLSVIIGMLAHVSTLFILVGFPHKPFTAGKGGL